MWREKEFCRLKDVYGAMDCDKELTTKLSLLKPNLSSKNIFLFSHIFTSDNFILLFINPLISIFFIKIILNQLISYCNSSAGFDYNLIILVYLKLLSYRSLISVLKYLIKSSSTWIIYNNILQLLLLD